MRPGAWPGGWNVLSPQFSPYWNDRGEPRPWRPGVVSGPRLPNFSDWQPGDVVLYAPEKYNAKQLVIAAAQRTSFAAEHACWTHCALYVGGGYIVDALGVGGVDKRPVETLTNDGHIRVRRLKAIDATAQQDVCNDANAWIGTGYAAIKATFAGLAQYFSPQWAQFILNLLQGDEALLYCAELIEAVYTAQLNVTVCNSTGLPLPAAYSRDSQFDEVLVGWRAAI
ncbi:MAG: hypothetical protein E6H66_24710 [Betaproteobacteria bacterium]|nr:MAG: hypothetical protein E6H66_24710 [Betaproteobacteria bacterium]